MMQDDPNTNMEGCIYNNIRNNNAQKIMIDNIDEFDQLFYTLKDFLRFGIYIDTIFDTTKDELIDIIKKQHKHIDPNIIDIVYEHNDIIDMINYYFPLSLAVDELNVVSFKNYNIDNILADMMRESAKCYYTVLYDKIFKLDYSDYYAIKNKETFISKLNNK